MTTIIREPYADRRSTYVIEMTFYDDAGVAVAPATLKWTLRDADRTVINERDEIVVTPDTTVRVVLSGDDLEMFDEGVAAWRHFAVEGTYDSTLGNGLPLVTGVAFEVRDVLAATDD